MSETVPWKRKTRHLAPSDNTQRREGGGADYSMGKKVEWSIQMIGRLF